MTISLDYLEDLKESGKLTKLPYEVISILVAAMNDWPRPVLSLADFEIEVYRSIGKDADKERIEKYLTNVDYTVNAWEAEAIGQILDIYKYYDWQKPLNEIVIEIVDKIKEINLTSPQ